MPTSKESVKSSRSSGNRNLHSSFGMPVLYDPNYPMKNTIGIFKKQKRHKKNQKKEEQISSQKKQTHHCKEKPQKIYSFDHLKENMRESNEFYGSIRNCPNLEHSEDTRETPNAPDFQLNQTPSFKVKSESCDDIHLLSSIKNISEKGHSHFFSFDIDCNLLFCSLLFAFFTQTK